MNDATEKAHNDSGPSRARVREPLLELTLTDADGDRLLCRDYGEADGSVRLVVTEGENPAVIVLTESQQDQLAAWLAPAAGEEPGGQYSPERVQARQNAEQTALETQAWAWLENYVKGGHCADRDYSADEMVDGFMAGFTQRQFHAQPSPPRPTCASCDHWNCTLPVPDFVKPSDQQDEGQCRLNGPVATGGMMSPAETIWPQTAASEWCGQHSSLSVRIEGEPMATAFHLPEPHDVLERVVAPLRGHFREPETPWLTWVADAAQLLGATKSANGMLWRVPGSKVQLTDSQLVELADDTRAAGEPQ